MRAELSSINPANSSLAKGTSIVDVHTHTFNARYLPLKNILLGKRDAAAPWTWLLSDHCAELLAESLIERTALAPVAGQPGARRVEGLRFHPEADAICRVLLGLFNKAAAKGCWRSDMSMGYKLEELDEVAAAMNPQERFAVRLAGHMMGMDEALETPDSKKDPLRFLVRFLWLLTQSDAEMTKYFHYEFRNTPGRISLQVSHMMDLGPVYNQPAEGTTLLDFDRKQVRRMEAFQARPGSGLVYFVAYNPYRDYLPGGQPGDALRLVQTAVKKHGARGVKFYPPSGYRPAGNSIFSPPSGPRSRAARAQWDARYLGLGDAAGRNQALDRNVEELLLWCIAEDVPVFVHSGTGEFEARKGYGLYHSNPKFWRQFLEAHPQRNRDGTISPCRLRLCLGHAGGGDFWFGETKHPDWGEDVYDLCREFPNVYCEITTHSDLTDPDRQAYFVDTVSRLIKGTHPAASPKPKHRFPARYDFGKKLLYGTDWYLPDSAERRDVLIATEQAFLHQGLVKYYQEYFGRNARRYLKLAR